MNLARSESTNWGHNFYVSYWRRGRHFMEIRATRRSSRLKNKRSTFISKTLRPWVLVPGIEPTPFRGAVKRSVSPGRPHKANIFTCKCSANKRLFSTWQFLRFFSLSSKTLDKNVYTSRTSVEEGSNSSACRYTKNKKKKHSKGESLKG